ncbi:hypothetical protein ACFE04_012790 [Oxalis oulophora]
MEGEGSSEMELTEIESSVDSIDRSTIFHVIKDILGFVLYMHQQIPSILQDMTIEFDFLNDEYKELDNALKETQVKASARRNHASRKREVKHGIKRLDKLMKTVSSIQIALQLMLTEVPRIQGVVLILGSSPIRPQHVYELNFAHGAPGGSVGAGEGDFTKCKAAEALSRKAVRALISKGAGSTVYPGPTKLFLLVKAPSSFNLPLHFLPKRDFKYSKKVFPFKLGFKCKTRDLELDVTSHISQTLETAGPTNLTEANSTSHDLIWYERQQLLRIQCGLPFHHTDAVPVSSRGQGLSIPDINRRMTSGWSYCSLALGI